MFKQLKTSRRTKPKSPEKKKKAGSDDDVLRDMSDDDVDESFDI